MLIGILALQGAFIEHEKMLDNLKVNYKEIRNIRDLEQKYDGIIIPGGESTTMAKLLDDLNMYSSLKAKIESGLPVFGTCAGMIMLATETANNHVNTLKTMHIRVRRNAYGRQLSSFYTEAEVKGIGTFPMVFIRAPYVESTSPDVNVLAELDGHIVACQEANQLATAFHPELTDDVRIHQLFIDICNSKR